MHKGIHSIPPLLPFLLTYSSSLKGCLEQNTLSDEHIIGCEVFVTALLCGMSLLTCGGRGCGVMRRERVRLEARVRSLGVANHS